MMKREPESSVAFQPPTEQDRENARIRKEIADRQQREYDEAKWLAYKALGPGWKPWMRLSLIPSDHHQTGDSTPAAVACKVYRGEQRLTDQSKYIRRMPDGQVLVADSYEPLFG